MMTDLSTSEKKAVQQIIAELVNDGTSVYYNKLLSMDYEEIPVDIDTFLRNPKYLGKGLVNEEGKFTVFPLLGRFVKRNFPRPIKTSHVQYISFNWGDRLR